MNKGPFKKKTSKVIIITSNVTVAARWAMATETSVIPWAIFDLCFWVNMQKRAFFVMACTYKENNSFQQMLCYSALYFEAY